jgi:hypothetical protein
LVSIISSLPEPQARPQARRLRVRRRLARPLAAVAADRLLGALADRRVALEDAREREFTQLVADHVLGDVHRHVLLAVVHGDGQADELGHDGRAPRPGLDRTFVVPGARLVDFGHQVMVDERALLD